MSQGSWFKAFLAAYKHEWRTNPGRAFVGTGAVVAGLFIAVMMALARTGEPPPPRTASPEDRAACAAVERSLTVVAEAPNIGSGLHEVARTGMLENVEAHDFGLQINFADVRNKLERVRLNDESVSFPVVLPDELRELGGICNDLEGVSVQVPEL